MKWTILPLILAASLCSAAEVEIIDTAGRSIRVTPVSVSADTVMVKRAGDKEPIAIALDKLTAESVKRCRVEVERGMRETSINSALALDEKRKALNAHSIDLKSGSVSLFTTVKGCSLSKAPAGDACVLIAPDGSSLGFVWIPTVRNTSELREYARKKIEEEVSLKPAAERDKELKEFAVVDYTTARFKGFSASRDNTKAPSKTLYLEENGKAFYVWTSTGTGKNRSTFAGRDINQDEIEIILSTLDLR